MQSVMAILKSKINITPGQMDHFLTLVLIKNGQQVTVVDRQEQRSFQHTAVLPGVEHIRRKRNIVHEHLPASVISKNLLVKAADKEDTDKTFHAFPHDMVTGRLLFPADGQQRRRRFARNESERVVELLLRNRKNIGNQAEQFQVILRLFAVRIGKLHKADQKKQLLFRTQFHFHLLADITDNLLLVKHKERIVVHLAQRIIKFDIFFMGTYSEVTGQIRMNGTTCLLPFNPHGGSKNSK